MDVRVLTLVTNVGGVGPGHSAVAVGETVYTFEDLFGGIASAASGWLTYTYSAYLEKNEHRPVLTQAIIGAHGQHVTDYVNKSIANDDDYLGSGVCSTQVAKAVNYSLPKDVDFNPKSFDTPFGVYHCAQRLMVVSGEEYFWPGKGSINAGTKGRICGKLQTDYPSAYPVIGT